MASEEPTLMFLRSKPKGWPRNRYIASSLQSLETSFLLIALDRFPHALTTCASAIENVLLEKFQGRKQRLNDLIKKATTHPSISQAGIDNQRLDDFLEARNTFVHQGFDSKDDSKASDLYIDVALPFLSACYQHFFSFDLSSSLLIELSKHLRIARRARQSVKETSDLNISYCLHGFSHLIRWELKTSFTANWESHAQAVAVSSGIKWDHLKKDRKSLESLFSPYWSFDCPVCGEADSAITEIAECGLTNRLIIPRRMACVECNFWVGQAHAFLSKFLLEEEAKEARGRILKEYGLS